MIDYDSLSELQELMEEAFPELVATYIEDCHIRINSIEKYLALNDAASVCEHAHSLKGSSANLFVLCLAGSGKKLEDEAREGNLENGKEYLENIKHLFAIVESTFRSKGWL